ncbi:MAG: PSD1 and planctomycete cytochrome C domain-containing protein [Akkermansiaceae bacterium]
MISRIYITAILSVLANAASVHAEDIVFNRDVRPILSQHCFACHGFDAHERKGKLRLDTMAGALKGGESGKPAIVPGKPEESDLWKRIISTEPDEVMPPKDFHKDLKPKQKEILKQWISEGAEYQGHWAFITPKKPAPPESAKFSNPIDKFVAARLQKEKLQFSPRAKPEVLLRRLSLDLTGLPPQTEHLSAAQYATLDKDIERLLASPHFGERMAVPWMDASRYADTNGYSIDGGRHAWLWRDWVINAFNTNKPFNEFLSEQLAGDLYPNATESQKIATGYNRNNANTHEGGTIPEENIVNYISDRVKTFGESMLGLTTSCSQCHDHKYDPLSQEEYFQFYAFFNSASDRAMDGNAGKNSHPTMMASSPISTPEEIASVKKELASAKTELRTIIPDELIIWEQSILSDEAKRGKDFKLIPLKHLTATLPNGDPRRLKVDPTNKFVTVKHGDYSAYNICAEIPEGTAPVRGLRVIFHPANKGKVGFGKNGTLVLNTVSPSFSAHPSKNIDHNSLIPPSRLTASSYRTGYEPSFLADTRRMNGWSPEVTTSTQHVTFTFPEPIDVSDKNYLTTELVFNYGRGNSPAKFEIQLFTGNDPDSEHSEELLSIINTNTDGRSAEQIRKLHEYFYKTSPQKSRTRNRVANLEERLSVLTEKHSTMIMDTAKKPRETRFLERGNYSSPKHIVHPGTPAFLPPLNLEKEKATRLDLARWLVRPDHPLTSRVAVNNIWAIFFGHGLVTSRADFGSQGTYPSHPELLDWLAVHFQESGWDVKALVRLIVTSHTYQQSSKSSEKLQELDPQNTLLARGPRFRLSAEHIRDQALAHSNLLVPRIGGPSVRTYHPGDLWRQVSHYGSSPATAQTYHRDHGEKLYRRSIYTYWKRTLPPPSMAVFDAPNREICTVGRGSTNTPLQAFILLNSPQFIEASRVLATHILKQDHPSDRARLIAAFTQVTGRVPLDEETSLLENSLAKELAKYKADPAAAAQLLSVGDRPRSSLPIPQHAAWTNVCQLLFNLSETVTRH